MAPIFYNYHPICLTDTSTVSSSGDVWYFKETVSKKVAVETKKQKLDRTSLEKQVLSRYQYNQKLPNLKIIKQSNYEQGNISSRRRC